MRFKPSNSSISADVRRTPVKEMPSEEKRQRGKYGKKEIPLDKKYIAISKNGDTLEISEDAKMLHRRTKQP